MAEFRVKPKSLRDYRRLYRDHGISGLIPRDRSDKGKPRRFGDADLEFILGAALPSRGLNGIFSVREIYRLHTEERVWRDDHLGKKLSDPDQKRYKAYLDCDGRLSERMRLNSASYATFLRWYERIPEVVRTMAREGGEAYQNRHEIISHREISATNPLQYVVMDHRRLDIFCLIRERRGWKLARPWLTAAIDMRTRKWLGWVVCETPSSDSIAAVLKQVFLAWGLPEEVYWDNGKDFRCEWLEGTHVKREGRRRLGELDLAWQGVMGTLGIRVRHAIVRRARSKIIEPNFGRIGDFDRTLPEYCGHKPGARPEWFQDMVKQHEAWAAGKRERTPFRTISQIAALYDQAIEDLNERELQGEGMQKTTPTGKGWCAPNECWELLIDQVPRRSVPLEVLQFAFNKRKELTIRHGELKMTFGGTPYHYRLRGNPVGLMPYEGKKVELAFDPLDLGEAVVYCESRLIGLADCVPLRHMGLNDFVEDERMRRAGRREIKKAIAAVHQGLPMLRAEERLARRQAAVPDRQQPERIEAPAALPAAIVEAAEAANADREFRFEDVAIELPCVEQVEPGEDEEFRFFQD